MTNNNFFLFPAKMVFNLLGILYCARLLSKTMDTTHSVVETNLSTVSNHVEETIYRTNLICMLSLNFVLSS